MKKEKLTKEEIKFFNTSDSNLKKFNNVTNALLMGSIVELNNVQYAATLVADGSFVICSVKEEQIEQVSITIEDLYKMSIKSNKETIDKLERENTLKRYIKYQKERNSE